MLIDEIDLNLYLFPDPLFKCISIQCLEACKVCGQGLTTATKQENGLSRFPNGVTMWNVEKTRYIILSMKPNLNRLQHVFPTLTHKKETKLCCKLLLVFTDVQCLHRTYVPACATRPLQYYY
jgi:hypothetical protein